MSGLNSKSSYQSTSIISETQIFSSKLPYLKNYPIKIKVVRKLMLNKSPKQIRYGRYLEIRMGWEDLRTK